MSEPSEQDGGQVTGEARGAGPACGNICSGHYVADRRWAVRRSQGRWTLDQTLGSAQKALRKSVGLLGWGSATDVSVAGSQADPQGRQTPTGQRSR